MNKEEINKKIAEFMGRKIHEQHDEYLVFLDPNDENIGICERKYTDSLDALVPVWEKLRVDFHTSASGDGFLLTDKRLDQAKTKAWHVFYDDCTSKQHAAALATAKAIQELEK